MWEIILGFFAIVSLYNELHFFLIKRRTKGPAKVLKGAEPFFKKRGKKAALLIHGFTSSPKELRELGNLLARNNITVYAPLLPGHGTTPERLAMTKYLQWVECVNEGIELLAEDHKEIFIIGNSFGGNLALISANKSKKVKGIITLGTPMYFKKERLWKVVLPFLKRIKIFQKKHYKDRANLQTIQKRRVAYNAIPLVSLTHLMKIVKLSKKSLKEIKKPTLVMQTENDMVIHEDSGDYIIKHISSKNKKKVMIPESYHVFILDKHRKIANQKVLEFVKKGKNLK